MHLQVYLMCVPRVKIYHFLFPSALLLPKANLHWTWIGNRKLRSKGWTRCALGHFSTFRLHNIKPVMCPFRHLRFLVLAHLCIYSLLFPSALISLTLLLLFLHLLISRSLPPFTNLTIPLPYGPLLHYSKHLSLLPPPLLLIFSNVKSQL